MFKYPDQGDKNFYMQRVLFIDKVDEIYILIKRLARLVFFYLGFLSQLFTNHRTSREEGGNFFNFSLPLPPASQTLSHMFEVKMFSDNIKDIYLWQCLWL